MRWLGQDDPEVPHSQPALAGSDLQNDVDADQLDGRRNNNGKKHEEREAVTHLRKSNVATR